MLGLSFLLSGACACSVAVVKSLKMGAHAHTQRGVSAVFDLQYFPRRDVCLVTSRFCHSQCSTLFMKGYFFFLSFFLFFFWSAFARSYTRALDHAAIGGHHHVHGNVRGSERDGWNIHMHVWDQPHLRKCHSSGKISALQAYQHPETAAWQQNLIKQLQREGLTERLLSTLPFLFFFFFRCNNLQSRCNAIRLGIDLQIKAEAPSSPEKPSTSKRGIFSCPFRHENKRTASWNRENVWTISGMSWFFWLQLGRRQSEGGD